MEIKNFFLISSPALCWLVLGLDLGAVPRIGRWSRCTYPFWVFASFLFFCVLYYKCILYITRGVPNKAVKKKQNKNKNKTKKHTCKKVRQSYGNIAMK